MATPGSSAQQASASSPGGPRLRLETADCDGPTVEEDHISRLTEDLLLDVLARLSSAREAARTSVLARRWRGLWTRLPELTFDDLDIPFHTLEGLVAQITSPALNLLHISIRDWEDDVTPEQVSSLLRAAVRLAPKTFNLQLHAEGLAVELPCFDRTTSLCLQLPYMDLAPPPGGQFSALERLVLHSSNLEPGSLLPMCPSLRSLHFEPYRSFDAVTVHSATLEELVIISQYDEGSCDIDCIDIMTPQLRKVSFRISWGDDFSMSFSAPLVEDIEVDCLFTHGKVGLQYMRLSRLSYLLKHGVHELHLDICCRDSLPYVTHGMWDLERSFEEEITRLPFSQFPILVLNLETEEHGFGPLVLHLLQIRPVRMLKVYLEHRASKVSCPLDCPCDQHTNWRNESISLTELELVTIYGLKGEDDEADFLQVLFRCATALKSMTVEVSPTGYNKVCGICEQYPQVKCDVSVVP